MPSDRRLASRIVVSLAAMACVGSARPPARSATRAAQTAHPASTPHCALTSQATIDAPGADYALGDAAIAAVGTNALITFTDAYNGQVDGGPSWESVWLDAAFPRIAGRDDHINSAAGCAVPVIVTATRAGAELTRFGHGLSRESGGMGDRHFALFVRRGRSQTDTRWQQPRQISADGRAGFVLGVSIGTELRCEDPCACNGTAENGVSLRTFVFTPSHTGSTLLIHLQPSDHGGPDVATAAVGSDRQAIAYRSGADLVLQPVDANGAALGAPRTIAHGQVGAPAIAFRGANLIVVWAQRESASAPYTLRYLEWDPTTATVPPTQALAAQSSSDSMLAPAIATDGQRVLLAWTEGDTSHRGTVHVASGTGPLAGVLATASVITTPDANARDPEVAVTPARAWITWQNFTHAHPRGERRVAQLHCDQ